MQRIGFRGSTAYAPGRQEERPAGPEHPDLQAFGGLDEPSSRLLTAFCSDSAISQPSFDLMIPPTRYLGIEKNKTLNRKCKHLSHQ